MVASAHAQEQAPAVVTQVVDGDTLDARLQDGRVIRVRLIGIDAPRALEPGAPAECGGPQAREELERLVQGREVILTNDASQGFVDAVGRALLYVDRASDGLDAGEQMLRRGRATVLVGDRAFARLPVYRRAQGAARNRRAGAWEACEGNFHLNPEEQARDDRRELLRSAVRFMRGYYAAVSARRFRAAWRRLAPTLRRQFGPFRSWRAGYRRSSRTTVVLSRARLSRARAVVLVRLRSRDRDVCSNRVVRQRFRTSWTLVRRGRSWRAVRVVARKTGGGRVRIRKSQCPRPKPPSPGGGREPGGPDCQGYSPCLTPGADVDCAGGSGNGPRYVRGPVSVRGSDPYGLDSDGDGVGCES